MHKRIKKHIQVNPEHLAWLEDTYPGIPLSITIDMLLQEFRHAHYISPADFAAIGAKAMKDMLDDG